MSFNFKNLAVSFGAEPTVDCECEPTAGQPCHQNSQPKPCQNRSENVEYWRDSQTRRRSELEALQQALTELLAKGALDKTAASLQDAPCGSSGSPG
jgi:hypothetical protein